MVFDEALDALGSELSGTAARLFLLLPHRLDFQRFRTLRQGDLAERLGITQSVVSRVLAELVSRRVIERKGRGPTLVWRLTRVAGYRGKAAQYHADQRDDPNTAPPPPKQAALPLGPSRVIRGGRAPRKANSAHLRALS